MITSSIPGHYFVSNVKTTAENILISTVKQYTMTVICKVSKEHTTWIVVQMLLYMSLNCQLGSTMTCRHTIFYPNISTNRTLDINSDKEKDRSKKHAENRNDDIQRPVHILRVIVIGRNPSRSFSIRVGTCCIPHIVEMNVESLLKMTEQ